MDAASLRGSGRDGFAVAVLRTVTWQAVWVTQALAFIFALTYWLEHLHQPAQPPFIESLLRQNIGALIVVLAAFAGDEAVRRGARLWHAFLAAVLGASAANVLVQSVLAYAPGWVDSEHGLLRAVDNFMILGAFWATVIMVILNRGEAQRVLTRLRAGELERLQAERRLVASRLSAAEAQIEPSALLRELAEVRDLYEAGRPEAEQRFETLITGLRESLARSAATQARELSR